MTGSGKPFLAFVVVLALALGAVPARAAAPPSPPSADEALEIATDAYIYAYPLVLMETTRRVLTNIEAPDGARQRAPVNQFAHVPAFPDAAAGDIARPNVDTLYSLLWFDLSREPLVIDVPDSVGRYYLLPMLDMWTDAFASPGKRTTGTAAQTWVLTGPGWRGGRLPGGVTEIKAPTNVGWLIGRTQTNGKSDYEAVRRFQNGLKAVPLSAWGRAGFMPLARKRNPKQDETAPVDQVDKMTADRFFALFAEVTRANPPHANDDPILQRMARIGLVPGRPFDIARISPGARVALEAARKSAAPKILAALQRLGNPVNGWRSIPNPIGTYGTDYLRRATIAFASLGANVVEDAVYPSALTDADGKPFDSGARYAMHFRNGQIPPARAFWSLTIYNDKQLFADNPLGRHAIGDRDPLKHNADGSLDLYIQRDSPGADKESNWLPAPKSGGFSMNLRLYWPKPAALDGSWAPPPVKRLP